MLFGCASFSLSAAADVAPRANPEPNAGVVGEVSKERLPHAEEQPERYHAEAKRERELGRGAVQQAGRPEPPKVLAAGRNVRAARASFIAAAAFLVLLAAFWMLMRWRKSRLYAQLAAMEAREKRSRSES